MVSLVCLLCMGYGLGKIARACGLPALVGMLIAGMIAGPYGLGWLGEDFLGASALLRRIALVVILARAGLGLAPEDIRRNGRQALQMSFMPAVFEIAGAWIFGPILLGLSRMESLLLGTVIAAVSPAVIVPSMLRTIERGYGTQKKVPHLILAGASMDDVVVIVLFTACLELVSGGEISWMQFLRIPTSILSGVGLGVLLGNILARLLRRTKHTMAEGVLLTSLFALGSSAIDGLSIPGTHGALAVSGLLAVMTMGCTLRARDKEWAVELQMSYSGIWAFSEILLFGLIGAAVDPSFLIRNLAPAAIFLILSLSARSIGVMAAVSGAGFSTREKIFCILGYIPKATVQAAVGGIALSRGLSCGETILTIAVLSIFLTAPLGSLIIERMTPRLLEKETPCSS